MFHPLKKFAPMTDNSGLCEYDNVDGILIIFLFAELLNDIHPV